MIPVFSGPFDIHSSPTLIDSGFQHDGSGLGSGIDIDIICVADELAAAHVYMECARGLRCPLLSSSSALDRSGADAVSAALGKCEGQQHRDFGSVSCAMPGPQKKKKTHITSSSSPIHFLSFVSLFPPSPLSLPPFPCLFPHTAALSFSPSRSHPSHYHRRPQRAPIITHTPPSAPRPPSPPPGAAAPPG